MPSVPLQVHLVPYSIRHQNNTLVINSASKSKFVNVWAPCKHCLCPYIPVSIGRRLCECGRDGPRSHAGPRSHVLQHRKQVSAMDSMPSEAVSLSCCFSCYLRNNLTWAKNFKTSKCHVKASENHSLLLFPGALWDWCLCMCCHGDSAVAEWLVAPDTQILLDFVRPDFLMLRVSEPQPFKLRMTWQWCFDSMGHPPEMHLKAGNRNWKLPETNAL